MKPTIVVGYNPAPHGVAALYEAAEEAVLHGARLIVVHAYREPPAAASSGSGPSAQKAAHDAAQCIADQGVRRAQERHAALDVVSQVGAGATPDILAASAVDAGLLVVGQRGGCSAGLLPCTVIVRAVTEAACPVMVVRGARHEVRGTVLAAIDLEDPAEEVLEFAFDEARRHRTGLKAISTRETLWPKVYAGGDKDGLRRAAIEAADNAELRLEQLLAPWQSRYPDIHVRHELADGPPGVILTAASAYSDLLVMGGGRRQHTAHADGTHLSPTVHKVVTHAECPVAIVPVS